MPVTAPTVDRCLDQRDLTEPRFDPTGRRVAFGASAGGVASLRCVDLSSGEERELATDPQPAVGRGMGAGCYAWLPDGTGVVYAGKDGHIYEQLLSGLARRIDGQHDHGPLHGVALSADARLIACVDSLQFLVVIDRSTGDARRVVHPHGFTVDPVWIGDTLHWQCWSAPHMPWDQAEIWRATAPDFVADRFLAVSGATIQQPEVSVVGVTGVLSDVNGWLRPCRVDNGDVVPLPMEGESRECGGPQWGAGLRSWCWSPRGDHYVVARNLDGFGDLAVVDARNGDTRTLARGVHGSVSWTRFGIVAVRTGAVTPTQIVFFAPDTIQRRVLATSELPCADGAWSDVTLVEPEIGTVEGVPYRVYRPDGHSGVADGVLIVWVHGGPTDQWQVIFMPRVAYWVGQGATVLVVDHRGTTGHGRAFQQSLNGHWGEFDTADVLAVTRHAHREGWGTPGRTVLMGGSAGGFTALNVAGTDPDICAGVVASYPVVDLADAAERSWVYEQHSITVLVGDLPRNARLYLQRSPLGKIASLAKVKVLLMHGDIDPAVPLDHSVLLAGDLRQHGGDVQLHIFEGEGHGFRQRVNQKREYALIGEFLRTL